MIAIGLRHQRSDSLPIDPPLGIFGIQSCGNLLRKTHSDVRLQSAQRQYGKQTC